VKVSLKDLKRAVVPTLPLDLKIHIMVWFVSQVMRRIE